MTIGSGPLRLVGSGLASARQVKSAAFASFGVAGLAGLLLAIAVGPELILVGLLCMVAPAGAYTGGPKPYGYYGLGELFVFVFFGLVATIGSTYIHTESLATQDMAVSSVAAIPVGLLAVALLVINNLRDIPTDTASGKRTVGGSPRRCGHSEPLPSAGRRRRHGNLGCLGGLEALGPPWTTRIGRRP